jgi:hypothetical protein
MYYNKMGLDFHCGNVSFGSSYSGWNAIRRDVVKATLDYIQDKFKNDFELYKDLPKQDPNWIGEGSSYNCYKNEIIELIDSMKLINNQIVFGMEYDNTIGNFITATRKISFIDALIYFDIGGLYSLCNKGDCEGYYSVGNSLDICLLFDLIQPFVKKFNEETHNTIYVEQPHHFTHRLYDLFKESSKQNKKITIS